MPGDDRGQAYTLEGVAASILVVSALLFALQSVVITPTTPGTIDRDTRAELSEQGVDALAAAHSNGSLSAAVRYYNVSVGVDANRSFYNPDPDDVTVSREFGYGQDRPPGEFGALLNQTFGQRGLTFNVVFEYQRSEDPTNRTERVFVKRGVPTDNSVSASTTVTLYDDQRVTAPVQQHMARSRPPTLAEAAANGTFFAPDVDPGPVFNVVRITVVMW